VKTLLPRVAPSVMMHEGYARRLASSKALFKIVNPEISGKESTADSGAINPGGYTWL
jgi:hypothetical protein